MSLEVYQNTTQIFIGMTALFGTLLGYVDRYKKLWLFLFILSVFGSIYYGIKTNKTANSQIASDKIGVIGLHKSDSINYTSKLLTLNDSVSLIIRMSSKLVNVADSNSNFNKNSFKQIIDILQKAQHKKDSALGLLTNQLQDMKEYTYYSTLDKDGLRGNGGISILEDRGINDIMSRISPSDMSGHVNIIDTRNALARIDTVIQKYPKYPFGYYIKFLILKYVKKDNDWKTYALKALSIFKITTSIVGHNPCQDSAVNGIKRELHIK